jgi:hypothetical protein
MRIQWQEEDVLHVARQSLAQRGYMVLACGGNQAGLFRFNIHNNRKAPDIVAYHGSCLFVAEAKVKPADLFKKAAHTGLSDIECMEVLNFNPQAQTQILKCGAIALKLLNVKVDGKCNLITGVIAGGNFTQEQIALVPKKLAIAESHPNGTFRIIRAAGLP